MLNLLLRLLITMVALKVADFLLPNFNLHGSLYSIAFFSIILGILNWLIKPVLVFFSVPLLILTLGLFYFVINALILYATSLIFPGVLTGTLFGFLIGSLFVTFLHWFLSAIFRVGRHE
jgi:putative membrane protein